MPPSFLNSDKVPVVVYFSEVGKTRDPRFDGLEQRVKNLEELPNNSTNHIVQGDDKWLKRNAFWLAPLVTLIFGSGAVATVAGLIIDHRIDAKLSNPIGRIGDQDKLIATMEGRLEGIGGMLTIVVQNETRRIASLNGAEFQDALPQIRTVFTVASNENLPPTPTLPEIRSRLRQVDDSKPGFWGAAAALVSYQSGPQGSSLPNCFNTSPTGTISPANGSLSQGKITTPATYQNCEIRLDDPRFPVVLTQYTLGGVLRLTNCHVVYNGGPITVPPGTTGTYRVELFACTYDLKVTKTPENSAGKTLVAGLLASNDPKNATIDLPTS
ncbi:MAG: hypothetical protein C5B58_03280 [Acidobacteria bacterium]|nr:MAG: hypothetical protein C5B58_03280 [Acidobacteriota bacterium]